MSESPGEERPATAVQPHHSEACSSASQETPMAAASPRHNTLSNEQPAQCSRTVREVMHFALLHPRRLSDKEPPGAPDAAINRAGANQPRRSELVSTYESHKEKHYEIDPNSELRQV